MATNHTELKYRTIRVTMTVDYLIPMADDKYSILDGRTPQQLMKEWFEEFDINHSHATRDAYRLGNGAKIKSKKVLPP